MISPTPKAPKADELLRLYAELAADDARASDGNSDDIANPEEVRQIRRALEMLDALRRSLHRDEKGKAEGGECRGEPPWIGPYRIECEIGRGGWGIVYRATDRRDNRTVALKLPRLEFSGHPQFGKRFVREARLLESLDHPNLVKVYEAGEVGWIGYLALEYCAGPNLKQWLSDNRGSIGPRQAAAIVAAVADGLEHVHQNGILHRDIKPTNILLDERSQDATLMAEGLAFVPRLVDFGLAKLTASSGETTHEGMLIGTPEYMSPEQSLGKLDSLSPASDTFALGIVLYELLTGRTPFAGDNELETRYRVANQPLQDFSVSESPIPDPLVAVCHKSLAKVAADRYQTAAEFAADLRRYLAGQSVLAPRPAKPGRLISRRAAIAAAVIGAAVGPAAWLAMRSIRTSSGAAGAESSYAAIAPIVDPRLQAQWIFHPNITEDQAGGRYLRPLAGEYYPDTQENLAVIAGEYQFARAGQVGALVFDGQSTAVYIRTNRSKLSLPVESITVEAWARWDVRDDIPFGSLIGAFQDNGNYEMGWVLGYQYRKFSFMLKGTSPKPLMTYLTSYEPFDLGRWYHVAGTYDGERQRLYVNGRMLGESTVQQGPILYPQHFHYGIGVYHDDDEFLTLEGQVHAISVYKAALTPEEIEAHFREKARLLPDMDKPHPGTARPMNSAQLWLAPPKPPGP